MSLVQPEHLTPTLAGHLVVFTGKLSSLGRRDARALVERLGGTTADDVNARVTMLVVGGEGFVGGASTSNKIKRVEELNAQHGASIRVLSEDEFCRLAGQTTPTELTRQYHATRDLLVRYRALREDHLRYLVKYGIVRPVLRNNADTFFTFQDLAPIKFANEEMAAGASFRHVLRAPAEGAPPAVLRGSLAGRERGAGERTGTQKLPTPERQTVISHRA